MSAIKKLIDALKAKAHKNLEELDAIDMAIPALQLLEVEQEEVAKPRKKKITRRSNGRHCAPGEMRDALLKAFTHYNGKPATGLQLARFVDKHRPKSLKRKRIQFASMKKRVTDELYRAKVEGSVAVAGTDGRAKLYVWKGKGK